MGNKVYVDIHVIQTVPPACINRDDIGRPKMAIYGGVNRARVSSQSWKHAMRVDFKEIFGENQTGYRTKRVISLVADKISEMTPDISKDEATKKAKEALKKAKIKIDDNENLTSALFFISAKQIEKLASLAVEGESQGKCYTDALKKHPAIDIALFGRMVADDAELNVDACAQVAHSISTHTVQNEYDYFTAADDCPSDNSGAGHLGTMEFNSSTLYRYATVNVLNLKNKIGADVENIADVVIGFVKAFIKSMPKGKQNSYANTTLPAAVYVTIRNDQPINLVGAFERPVRTEEDGFEKASKRALKTYAEMVYEDYCAEPKKSFVLGMEPIGQAEKVNYRELMEGISAAIKDEVK